MGAETEGGSAESRLERERVVWYEHGKPSKRPIPGILARARRHVCKMQVEKHNMQARKDTSRYERASGKKAT